MANNNETVRILELAKAALQQRSFENISPAQISSLSQAIPIYIAYCKEPFTAGTLDTRISEEDNSGERLKAFHRIAPLPEIQDIINYLSQEPEAEKELRTKPPAKEESTVPAELETLVAQYKESQADKLEADTTHTVADAVKRARKTWETRNRAQIIRKNRLALIEDEAERKKQTEIENLKRDRFFVESVDSKAESAAIIYKNTYRLAQQAVIAQASNLGLGLTPVQIHRAVEDLTYLGVTGAVDFTNFHDLNIVSQLAFINQGITITSSVNHVDSVVQAWSHEIDTDPFSSKPDDLEKEIILADQEAEKKLRESTQAFEDELKKKYLAPKDLYEDAAQAKLELEKIQKALLKAIPNAKFPPPPPTPLQEHGKELESILRKEDPTKLSLLINPEGLGARTVAILETTNSGNRNISPEAVRLLSLGLTPEKLEALRNDPNSQLNKFIAGNKYGLSVYQQVHFQLNNLIGPNSESKLGQKIVGNIKPLSGISKNITHFYNRQPSIVQSVTKFILNPRGTVEAWVNKKIGQHAGNVILKYAGSTASKKLGNFILKEGLKEGAKKFVDAVAKKVVVAAAKQIGIQGVKMAGIVAAESTIAALAAALGVPTFGLSLIVGAILMVAAAVVDATIGLTKKGLDNVWRELGWGDKFRSRDLIIPVVAGGAVVATAGATFFAGLIAIRRSVQVAVVSAAGIIIGSLVVMGIYVAIAFLIAPILSTLVQFDSLSKVDYAEYGGGSGPGVSGPGPGGEGGGGGVVDLDCGEEAGAEITIQAGSYPVTKKLLTGAGRTGYCIVPTKIVIHWSGGWTNNDATYYTLEERGLSCQIGTDQDGSVQQWQQMWEKKSELAYCVGGNENNYCLNNEMVGAYFIPPGSLPTKPENKAPSSDEIKSAVNSTCFMMKQYNIPYTQIFGHYELHPGKPDPGVEFLDYFINQVKAQCP